MPGDLNRMASVGMMMWTVVQCAFKLVNETTTWGGATGSMIKTLKCGDTVLGHFEDPYRPLAPGETLATYRFPGMASLCKEFLYSIYMKTDTGVLYHCSQRQVDKAWVCRTKTTDNIGAKIEMSSNPVQAELGAALSKDWTCLLYTSPSPRD